jgi:hypothetical protein
MSLAVQNSNRFHIVGDPVTYSVDSITNKIVPSLRVRKFKKKIEETYSDMYLLDESKPGEVCAHCLLCDPYAKTNNTILLTYTSSTPPRVSFTNLLKLLKLF